MSRPSSNRFPQPVLLAGSRGDGAPPDGALRGARQRTTTSRSSPAGCADVPSCPRESVRNGVEIIRVAVGRVRPVAALAPRVELRARISRGALRTALTSAASRRRHVRHRPADHRQRGARNRRAPAPRAARRDQRGRVSRRSPSRSIASRTGRSSGSCAFSSSHVSAPRRPRRRDRRRRCGGVSRTKGARPERLRVIPNWTDVPNASLRSREVNAWSSRRERPDEKFVVMHSGNVGHAQDLDTLIRATTLLRDLDDLRRADHRNRCAPMRSCRELAEVLEADKVRFLEFQPRELCRRRLRPPTCTSSASRAASPGTSSRAACTASLPPAVR